MNKLTAIVFCHVVASSSLAEYWEAAPVRAGGGSTPLYSRSPTRLSNAYNMSV